MTTTETRIHKQNLHATWKFIYNDTSYLTELTTRFKQGFYLNMQTNEKYSFQQGIEHIVGKDDEMSVYNMWWLSTL
jgi:hypothetical protein